MSDQAELDFCDQHNGTMTSRNPGDWVDVLLVVPSNTPCGFEAAIVSLRPNQCRWPIGNPDEPGFHFCAESKVDGSSYCAPHAWDSRLVKRGKRPSERQLFVSAVSEYRPPSAKILASLPAPHQSTTARKQS